MIFTGIVIFVCGGNNVSVVEEDRWLKEIVESGKKAVDI